MNIYHILKKEEWGSAREAGVYRGESLAKEGFIHCCTHDQIQGVLRQWYQGQNNLLLIEINPDLLDAEVRYEKPSGADEKFPHIYGSITLKAVVGETTLNSNY